MDAETKAVLYSARTIVNHLHGATRGLATLRDDLKIALDRCTKAHPLDEKVGALDAETKAVFDKAWEVVNQESPQKTYVNMGLKLKAALQEHAKVHRPELSPKSADEKGPEPPSGDAIANCFQCGIAPLVGRCNDATLAIVWYYIQCPRCGRRNMACSTRREAIDSWNLGDVLDAGTTKGPTPGRYWPDNVDESCVILPGDKRVAQLATKAVSCGLCGECGAPVFHGGGRCLVNHRCGDTPQPTILQLEKGDVCVFTCKSKMDCEKLERLREHWDKFSPDTLAIIGDDESPNVQVLRPAKGDNPK